MSTRNRYGVDGFLTQLFGDLRQLVSLQAAQRVWCIYPIEQRCLGGAYELVAWRSVAMVIHELH
jgi:hypothetical protein